MPSDSRHIQIAFSLKKVLADDGRLDLKELDYLLGLALQDGEIDSNERRILALLFQNLQEKDVAPDAWVKIGAVRAKYGI